MSVRPFRIVPSIEFGSGASGLLPDRVIELGGGPVLVVTDPGVRRAGIESRLTALLKQHGLEVSVFAGVSPNPRDSECLEAVAVARAAGVRVIVAIGGGSPIDLAKAVAGLVTNGGTVQDWRPPRTFAMTPLPLIAVPTTAGTGSEVTRSAVINDTRQQIKISLRDYRIAPRVALLDPELTVTLPAAISAATGMDALTHAIEAYTCSLATPLTDALALQAIEIISTWLPKAVSNGNDLQAREQMLLGSLIAGMAFGNSDVAAVHCIAEAIGGRYDTPHGVANSMFLPFLFAFNAETTPDRHASVARAMHVDMPENAPGPDVAAAGSERLFALAREIGIPRFSELPGIASDDFPWIAAASAANLSNSSNAREIGETDYITILEQAWAYTG